MKVNIGVWKMSNQLEVNRSTQVRHQAQCIYSKRFFTMTVVEMFSVISKSVTDKLTNKLI